MDTLGPLVVKLMSTMVAGTVLATSTDLPAILEGITSAGPVIITINQMEIAKTVLFAENLYNGGYPKDIGEALRRNIGGKPHPELDEWGKPFELHGAPQAPYLQSCGPDKRCGNDDDLRVYIERVPAGAKQSNLSDALTDRLLKVLKPAAEEQAAQQNAQGQGAAPVVVPGAPNHPAAPH